MPHSSEYEYYILIHSLIHVLAHTADHLYNGVPNTHTENHYQIHTNKTFELFSYLDVYFVSFRLLFLTSKLAIETLGNVND
jgi:hypothetical protein